MNIITNIKSDKAIIINIVVLVSFLFTSLPVYFGVENEWRIPTLLFILAICFLQCYLIRQSYLEKSHFLFDFKNADCKNKIASFMLEKMSNAGSIAIFSRDLSWVEERSCSKLQLEKKAERGELSLFIQGNTKNKADQKIKDLFDYGAHIYFYNNQIHPRSRFTILNYKQAGAEIMIGLRERNSHIIKIINSKDHLESFSMVLDYLEYLEKTSKKQT